MNEDYKLMDQIARGNAGLMRSGQNPSGLNYVAGEQTWVHNADGSESAKVRFGCDNETGQIYFHYSEQKPGTNVCRANVIDGMFELRRMNDLKQIVGTVLPEETGSFVREVIGLSVRKYAEAPTDITPRVTPVRTVAPVIERTWVDGVLEYFGF